MSVDWAHLPGDLLGAISERLLLYADYVRFRAVCRGWRSAVAAIPHHLPPQPPWLLLPLYQPYYYYDSPSSNCFYDLLDNSIKKLGHLSPMVPELSPYTRKCGSSHGWLVVLDYSPRILLFNPLTNSKINLPDLTTFPNVVGVSFANIGKEYSIVRGGGNPVTYSVQDMRDVFVRKVVLSNSPGVDFDFIALALLDTFGDLVYCRRGEDCWKDLVVGDSQFEDVIFSDGSFYCVDRYGGIAICDLSSNSPRVSHVKSRMMRRGDVQYLVTVGKDLVLVARFLEFGEVEDRSGYKTSSFEAFRMDWSSNDPRWEQIDSLGDYAVFIYELFILCVGGRFSWMCGGADIFH